MSKVLAKFAAAAANIGNLKPNDSGNYGKFVNLAAILDAATPTLVAHGVNVVQMCGRDDEGRVTVKTLAVDLETGETVEVGTFAGAAPDPQKAGSIISYGRRYCLSTALGIVGDTDADQVPVKAPVRPAKASDDGPSTARPAGGISSAQLKALQTRFSATPRDERLAFWAEQIGRPVASANELTKREAIKLLTEDDGLVPFDE